MMPRHCPSCGHVIAAGGHLAGLCPACLLRTSALRPVLEYRVIGPLGNGVRGPLVMAESRAGAPRLLTVKVVPAAPDARADAGRLDAVLDRIAAAGHPGLLPYLDGEWIDDGRLRLVADYVPGSELSVFLRREGPPPALRASLLAAACEAVGAAQRSGLTSGHFTASDVLIVARGSTRPPTVVVRDFGLADVMGLAPGRGEDLRALARLVAEVAAAGKLEGAAIDEVVAELRYAGEDPVAAAGVAARAARALAAVAGDSR